MSTSTLRTITCGCKVNQYETEYVRQGLLDVGYRDAMDGEPAELCIVNTCTVTRAGDAKSRRAVRRLARENPDTRIVVMGCYATRAPEELAALPGVVEVVTDKRGLPDLLRRFGVTDVPTGLSHFGKRHRAFVKVQDGCSLRCSYCIIPTVRPNLSSRPIEHILDEVRRLVAGGYREIVLTGIHLGHYGVDWSVSRPTSDRIRLWDLVRQIVQVNGDFRVRLSSIEATEVTRKLIELMAEQGDRICPHLHMCLQSGSDSVLRRMNRRWSTQRFLDRCQMVREVLDQPAFTTDVMVGFPGETEAEFAETCAVVREVGFSKIHIFPFSPRCGTPAAELPGQVPQKVKSERGRQLAQIEGQLRQQYFQSLLGTRLRVLVESALAKRPGYLVGTSCRYAPAELPGDQRLLGHFVDVRASEAVDGRIRSVGW